MQNVFSGLCPGGEAYPDKTNHSLSVAVDIGFTYAVEAVLCNRLVMQQEVCPRNTRNKNELRGASYLFNISVITRQN